MEMRNMMKKRRTAGLLAGMLILSTVFGGCGNAGANAAGDEGTEIGKNETEAVQGEITALSLMEQYNVAEQRVTDDNYRTYYEVFVYSFYDSDGDGVGDLKGLTEKLDYINDGDPSTTTDLGCNGIWLMPVMPSPTYHKYDVTDYYEIDPEYGTLDDFKAFIEECDKRGIRVILDLVMNHSSSEHEWFQKACEYLKNLPVGAEPDPAECPYVDYYFFSRTKESGYENLSGTDWYYEAQFWGGMPDLNLGNEAVRAEFEAIADYWLELGVGGFRLDAAKEYYTGDDTKNIEVLTWFNDMVKSKKEDAYIVAEVWNGMTYYTQYTVSGVSCFDFDFADKSGVIAKALKNSNAVSYANNLVTVQEMLAEQHADYIDAPFYTNHDMGRSAGYYAGEFSEHQVKMAQAMNLLMSGSSFLYYGEELGMKGSGIDENKRAAMYWSADNNADGMCDGPEAMEDFDMKYGSLAEQEIDGNSIYNFVKQTILLRNQFPALSHGTVEVETGLMTDESICAVKKTYEEESVLLVYSLAQESKTIDLAKVTLLEGELEISGVLLTGAEDITVEGTTVTMPPYTVLVITEK